MAFLPIDKQEMKRLGWDRPDFVYVTGDAYVDHPSFGLAIISRILEKAGYRVAMLPQPDWHSCEDFRRFGRPKIGFLVTAGVIDSMVNHYTAAKKPRSEDAYSPGGKAGCRPDRATIVYTNRIREAYPGCPIAIGGVEASLRRFAHYDYWDDRVRNSVLVDSGADVLMFGMGERSILSVAKWMAEGRDFAEMRVPGTCVMVAEPPQNAVELDSWEEVSRDRKKYARSFKQYYDQQDPVRGKPVCQKHGKKYLLQNPPDMPLSREEMDAVYALPYMRKWHPSYDKMGGIPALSEVRFSITSVRGCFGACNFCALTFHQGRIVTSRSKNSILEEAKLLTRQKDFKGYIHDVGGPTANFRKPACRKQLASGACKDRQCLFPTACRNLVADHSEYVDILRSLRALPGVKKVFVRSGLRFDYMLKDKSDAFLRELVEHHVSGQLKVAPEHVSPNALKYMGKPNANVYEEFVRRYEAMNRELGLKQYLVPYFMSSHPGCTLQDAIQLALFMHKTGQRPDQVQDFYPTPGTLSTAMFHTGIDPRDMTEVYVPRDPHEKAMQRALMQYNRPENHALVLEALRRCGRDDLIGFGRECLIPPRVLSKNKPSGGSAASNKSSAASNKSSAPSGKGNAASGKGNAASGKGSAPSGKGRSNAAQGNPSAKRDSGAGKRNGAPAKHGGAPAKKDAPADRRASRPPKHPTKGGRR